jgi:hypothetical protein
MGMEQEPLKNLLLVPLSDLIPLQSSLYITGIGYVSIQIPDPPP